MSARKLLVVTQEMNPYTAISTISETVKNLPKYSNENGFEVRILMPRFGVINERRHRLHEVVRLSGMNIIVDDEDFPLIIKVASLPGARLQVYFLDNEEFFKRKFVFKDEEEEYFDDNQERMVFFCKGAMEIVKKFGWAPDVIHCHGPFTSLIPLYAKTAYKNDPVFQNSKVIYSAYEDELSSNFTSAFFDIAAINDLESESIESYKTEEKVDLNKGGILHADGVVAGSESIDINVINPEIETPVLDYTDNEELPKACISFYDQFIEEDE